MVFNETLDLGEAERDLGEASFPELGRKRIFIEVMAIVLLIISFHYKIVKILN